MVNKSRVFLDSATGCLISTSNLDRSVVIHLISSYPVEPYPSVIRVYRHGPGRGRRAVTSPSRGGRTSCRRPGTRGGPRPSSGRRARRGFSGAFRSEDGRSRAASTWGDLQATRRERHGESSYAHVLLAFLFLTDEAIRLRQDYRAPHVCYFFFSVVKRAKTGFSSTRKTTVS